MKGLMMLIALSCTFLVSQGQSTGLQDPNAAKTRNPSGKLAGQSVVAQKTYKTDAQTMNLKGSVKSIRATGYDAIEKDGEIITTGISKYTMTRVERRQISKTSSFSMYLTDTIIDKGFLNNLSLFDSTGNIISSIFYDSLGKVDVVRKIRYLRPGMRAEELSYHGSGDHHFRRMLYSYDRRGYLKELTEHDSLNQITYRQRYTNQLLTKESYKRTIQTEEKRKLPVHGAIYTTVQRRFSPYTIYILDERRNVISEESFWKNGRRLILQEYDNQNRLISRRYYSKSFGEYENPRKVPYQEERQDQWNYDVIGNVLNDWMYSYSYTYDHMGNWIRQAVRSRSSNYNLVRERQIEYY